MVRSVVVALAVALTAAPSTVQGYAKYVKLVPNGGNVPDNSNIGHLDPAGETGLSDFGRYRRRWLHQRTGAWRPMLHVDDEQHSWTRRGWRERPVGRHQDPTSSELKAGCSSSGTSTSANFTGSGDSVGDVVGTVSPAGPTTGGMPPDDDEDDSSESAVLTAGASMTTISSVAMGVATVVVLAVVL
ncbi:hypothetical protein GQ600_20639 [Phytophthora cactorum]|nr:hypothetical protein GQ600_20639 [Phytophthora cactorum]